MTVTHAYTDPTTIRNFMVEPGFYKIKPFTQGMAIYRVFNTKNTKLVGGFKNSETPKKAPIGKVFKLVNRGNLIFATYPPIYKTAKGSTSSKYPTPRQFPPIFVGTSR